MIAALTIFVWQGRNALTGIYCFLGINWRPLAIAVGMMGRNALTGIYCFLGGREGRRHYDRRAVGRNALTGIYCFLGLPKLLRPRLLATLEVLS